MQIHSVWFMFNRTSTLSHSLSSSQWKSHGMYIVGNVNAENHLHVSYLNLAPLACMYDSIQWLYFGPISSSNRKGFSLTNRHISLAYPLAPFVYPDDYMLGTGKGYLHIAKGIQLGHTSGRILYLACSPFCAVMDGLYLSKSKTRRCAVLLCKTTHRTFVVFVNTTQSNV